MAFSIASFFTTILCLFIMVQASPFALNARAALDVFVPKIIKPDSQTIWIVGQNATVVWDTSDAPASISNGAAVVLSGGGGTLAQGFDLRSGSVTFLVPDVTPGPRFITLFGDSGNFSPVFTIEAAV